MLSKVEIIQNLQLEPHPEGGYYKEVYRAEGRLSSDLGEAFEGERNYCTSIYFLLDSDSFSAFHRIKQDETWHFYLGSTLHLYEIDQEGKLIRTRIGSDLHKGEQLQYTVKAQNWFAAEVPSADSYALLGCTVAPGFDFRDFELAEADTLIASYPQHQALIQRLCIR